MPENLRMDEPELVWDLQAALGDYLAHASAG